MVNDEIREMTRRFVEALHPQKIILFGSYAKDTYRDDSDYDFYIIMPDDTQDLIARTGEAYKSLRDLRSRTPVDILMNTATMFNDRKARLTMERIVQREGVVLYG